MKKLIANVIILGMLIMPFMVYAQSEQTTEQAPPVAPALVREGDFAIKLVGALKIGTAQNEADAETMLGSSGIAPKNGWIADYPVTPDIIGELQNTVGAAADSQRLPMGKEEALKALQSVSAELGLSVVADTSDKYSENQPPTSPRYTEPSVVNNYYYEEGPPVVTYYPPPWDYYYLYAWVPSPFWCSGFFFPGFFILHDFHRVVHVHSRVVVFTNHVIHPVSKRVVVVDPLKRTSSHPFGGQRDISHQQGFNSAEARRGARSIFERNHERARPGNAMTTTNGRNIGRSEGGTVSRGMNQRTFNQPGNIERRNEMNIQRPSGGQGRSLTSPNVTHERSFSAPSTGSRGVGSSGSSGRTFSAPGRSFNPPSTESRGSFGRSRAEGGGRSFGNGGFAGAGGRGGCRGRC
jgi:hypothetical protein